MEAPTARILFCNCTYAQVVPKETKTAVLQRLCQSDRPFEAVADLCEMSARRDPALQALAQSGPLKIAACYPRAVKWLFAASHAPLSPENVQVVNMRVEASESAANSLLDQICQPNLPTGKVTQEDHPAASAA